MTIPVIIGGGLAGLSVALALAPKPVIVIGRKQDSGLTSSELAQGGIAAAVGYDDTLKLHEQDTLAAGAGLCDPQIVRSVIATGPQAIERLAVWGVLFDRDKMNDLAIGLEGAHSRRRIVHADGDSTGAAVMRSVLARVRAAKSITFLEDCEVFEITRNEKGVTGVAYYQGEDAQPLHISTSHVILATGSACALWRHTTVPEASWGHGLLLAARAGARLRDLEFVQFHPTALDNGLEPMQLLSEALRGEGALLINSKEQQFVGELNPRDVVARAIWDQIERGQKVYLDARALKDFRSHFPNILDACLKSGIDPREMPIPVRPVAHYHMGGVGTDAHGRTNVEGLWACGECACSGLHGANRLASNSLLEAVVMGCRVADDIRPRIPLQGAAEVNAYADVKERHKEKQEDVARVRNMMMSYVGLRRNAKGLEEVIAFLEGIKEGSLHAQVALMIAKAALARQESRGAHDRADYPATDPAQASSHYVTLKDGEIIVN